MENTESIVAHVYIVQDQQQRQHRNPGLDQQNFIIIGMKTFKVLDRKNLPTKLPVTLTLVVALSLDYWNAPDWVIGGFGALGIIIWILSIIRLVLQEQTDILKDEKDN